MALEKNEKQDQITIDEWGCVFCRTTIIITDDGKEISKSYTRTSYAPGSDVSQAAARVASICQLLWTPEVIAAYNQHLEDSKPPVMNGA